MGDLAADTEVREQDSPLSVYVEALGFPNDPAYMMKAQNKMKLAARLGIPLVAVTHSDSGDLASIFTTWLPKGRPVARETSVEAPD